MLDSTRERIAMVLFLGGMALATLSLLYIARAVLLRLATLD